MKHRKVFDGQCQISQMLLLGYNKDEKRELTIGFSSMVTLKRTVLAKPDWSAFKMDKRNRRPLYR